VMMQIFRTCKKSSKKEEALKTELESTNPRSHWLISWSLTSLVRNLHSTITTPFLCTAEVVSLLNQVKSARQNQNMNLQNWESKWWKQNLKINLMPWATTFQR
jgi:hypothetical protein